MDGLCLYASQLEMQSLVGGKIDKAAQPEKEDIIFTVRNEGRNYKLLLSASAARCGVHITEQKRPNPIQAPMFCMLLRKHLCGGRILSVEQPDMDRVLRMSIQSHDELGDTAQYTLLAEVMGKHSNIVLLQSDGTIVDAIKRVGLGMSVRTILPGMAYEPPPAQSKQDPRTAEPADFMRVLLEAPRMDKALSGAFFGLSPSTAAALLQRTTDKLDAATMTEGELQSAVASLCDFYASLRAGKYTAAALCDEYGQAVAVYPFLPTGDNVQTFEGMGVALDALYAQHEVHDHLQKRGASLRHVLQNNIERIEKKLALYTDALQNEEGMERDRRFGELLTANLHSLPQNASEAVVTDYYADPPQSLVIPMDKLLSPGANAQRYYKKYRKAKTARDKAGALQEQALEELAYLEGQMDNLHKCATETELLEIAQELREQGYIKPEPGRAKPQKLPASKPLHYIASDGTDIFVGKNNRQNDALTLHTAGPEDMWLHTKNIPGSHVIIKSAAPKKQTLFEAAMLAAYYSKARGGENIPVDYTPRKYVKKPSGAKPGMVIYTTNQTAYVTPDESVIKNLKLVD